MVNRWLAAAAAVFLVLAGCSKEEAKPAEKPEKTEAVQAETNPETENSEEQEEQTESAENTLDPQLMADIQAVPVSGTLEDWKQRNPGMMTKDFPLKEEIREFPAPISEMDEQAKAELGQILAQTQDEETVYKALLYYYGSAAIPDLVKEMESFQPGFTEPFLPEPGQEYAEAEKKKKNSPPKSYLILDASTSMFQLIDGKPRMDVAKKAVKRFAKTVGSSTDVSLYVYGHKGTDTEKDKALSCRHIDEYYKLGKYDEQKFDKAVDGIEPKGWTALAGAIKEVREASKGEEGELTLYIVSDGAETCGGDPVKEAKKFAADHKGGKVNIIGFDVDGKAENQLKKVAKAGNGEYIGANSTDELNKSMEKKWIIPDLFDILKIKTDTPKGSWAYSKAMDELRTTNMRINLAGRVEQSRLIGISRILRNEGLMTEEQLSSLQKRAEENSRLLEEQNEQLFEAKKAEVDAESDRIEKKVNAWADKMDELRKEQNK